jgi:uncharacterized protein YraI
MKPRSQIPFLTKIYLSILVYLSILLIILFILRSRNVAMNWMDIQGLLPGSGTDMAAQLTGTAQSTPAPEPTYPAGVPWLRATTNTPVYDAPGGATQPAAMLVAGQTMPVVGSTADRQWFAISVPYFENGQGWVPAGQVTVQNAEQVPLAGAQNAASTAPLSTEQMPVALAVANVNVRSGPDMNFDKIGLLNNGQEVEIIGVSPDRLWWAIRLPTDPDTTGWVAKDYIVARNEDNVPVLGLESGTEGGAVTSPQPGKASLTAAWTVNIRAGPGKQYAIVGTLQQGQSAEIVGRSEDAIWWAIRFDSPEGEHGWVAAAYAEAQNAENVPVLK